MYFLSGCCTCSVIPTHLKAGTWQTLLSGLFLTTKCQSEHHHVRQCVRTHSHTVRSGMAAILSVVLIYNANTSCWLNTRLENWDQLLHWEAAWNLGNGNKKYSRLPSACLLSLVFSKHTFSTVFFFFVKLFFYLCSLYRGHVICFVFIWCFFPWQAKHLLIQWL